MHCWGYDGWKIAKGEIAREQFNRMKEGLKD